MAWTKIKNVTEPLRYILPSQAFVAIFYIVQTLLNANERTNRYHSLAFGAAQAEANACERWRTPKIERERVICTIGSSLYRIRSPSICTDRSLSQTCKHALRRVCEERENVEVYLYVPDIPSVERRVRRVRARNVHVDLQEYQSYGFRPFGSVRKSPPRNVKSNKISIKKNDVRFNSRSIFKSNTGESHDNPRACTDPTAIIRTTPPFHCDHVTPSV